MNTPVYLSRPTLTSILGSGLQVYVEALFTPSENTSLTLSDQRVKGKAHILGAIKETLMPLPDSIPEAHRSRNDQLILHALSQIDGLIQTAITRYDKERVAIVTSTSINGADENILLFQYVVQGGAQTDIPFEQLQYTMASPFGSTAQIYGLNSLHYTVSTACIPGARTLINAARLLCARLCDVVICGGVDTLFLLTINGLASLEMLSDGIAKPFFANRSGTNIGEAAALFVMTRNADFSGEMQLLGYGANGDAYHMSSLRPDGLGVAQSFQIVSDKAGLKAEDIGWINLYGTGTQHNDSMESRTVTKVFGNHTLCTLAKPSIGHTLGAAGTIEAALAWLMVSRQYNPEGRPPPQRWDGVPDSKSSNITLTDGSSRWPSEERIAASSSSAFGGNNVILIIG